MSILSHDEFCRIINYIEKIHNFEDELDNICNKYDRQYFTTSYSDGDTEELLFKVLQTMFDCGDIIEWWVYDADFGHDAECWIEEHGCRTYLRNASELYNFLTNGE